MPDAPHPIPIPLDSPVWSRFFTVAPLVIVGTKEPDGSFDLAPKHMATPIGYQNLYGFVCSPRHATQRNAQTTGQFTVSFPHADHILDASMAAGPRFADGSKPSLAALETVPATRVDGVLVRDSYLWLECELERVVADFGDNSLIVGTVVAAAVDERALRDSDGDDADLIHSSPVLAYLSPGRFAAVDRSYSFPYPVSFRY